MGAEDQPAHDLLGLCVPRIVLVVAARHGQPGVDRDQVGLLARLDRPDAIVEAERTRSIQ